MMRMFEEEEIVWDCDTFEGPGPDAVNFGFLIFFWEYVKYNFMNFMCEFHANRKLGNWSNRIFIVFILNKENFRQFKEFRLTHNSCWMYI